MKNTLKYCGNVHCRYYKIGLRQRCRQAIKGKVDVATCEVRKQNRLTGRHKAVAKFRNAHKDWWNAYQRLRHGRPGGNIKIAHGIHYDKSILVNDCPFCHGRHLHKKGSLIKSAQCGQGFYLIRLGNL